MVRPARIVSAAPKRRSRPVGELIPVVVVDVLGSEELRRGHGDALPDHAGRELLEHITALTISSELAEQPRPIGILIGVRHIRMLDYGPGHGVPVQQPDDLATESIGADLGSQECSDHLVLGDVGYDIHASSIPTELRVRGAFNSGHNIDREDRGL